MLDGNFRERCWEIVEAVPVGRVVTYGQVAALAGFPRRARQVGKAMGSSPPTVPWWRVLNARGQIRTVPAEEQESLLRAEGVLVRNGLVRLERFQWTPSPLTFVQ